MDTEIDPRLRFYFENQRLIDEWSSLPQLEEERADDFFRGLGKDLESALTDFTQEPELFSETDIKWKKHHVLLSDWRDSLSERPAMSIAIEWTEGTGFRGAYLGVWANREAEVYADLYAQLKATLGSDEFATDHHAWITKQDVEAPEKFWEDLAGFGDGIVEAIQEHWDQRVDALEKAYDAVRDAKIRGR